MDDRNYSARMELLLALLVLVSVVVLYFYLSGKGDIIEVEPGRYVQVKQD